MVDGLEAGDDISVTITGVVAGMRGDQLEVMYEDDGIRSEPGLPAEREDEEPTLRGEGPEDLEAIGGLAGEGGQKSDGSGGKGRKNKKHDMAGKTGSPWGSLLDAYGE